MQWHHQSGGCHTTYSFPGCWYCSCPRAPCSYAASHSAVGTSSSWTHIACQDQSGGTSSSLPLPSMLLDQWGSTKYSRSGDVCYDSSPVPFVCQTLAFLGADTRIENMSFNRAARLPKQNKHVAFGTFTSWFTVLCIVEQFQWELPRVSLSENSLY